MPSIVLCCAPEGEFDTEAHWTKSGWHALVYSWKLHVVSVVAPLWFPIAAVLTPANVADSDPAPELLREVLAEVRFPLGDRHDHTPELRQRMSSRMIISLLPAGMGAIPILMMASRCDASSINCAQWPWQVPIKGLVPTQRFALEAIFIYQLALVYRFEHELDLCIGLKAFLKAT